MDSVASVKQTLLWVIGNFIYEKCKHTKTKKNGICKDCGYNTLHLPNKKLKEKKVDDRPRCDNCGKLATRNLQECWVEWSIDRKGNYSENPVDYEECGGDSIHLCDNCEY